MASSTPSKTRSHPPTVKKPSHSTIYTATSRDHDRMKLAQKQDIKHERAYEQLERKMISHAKWNQRVENNNLRVQGPTNDHSTTSVDEWMRRQRNKQENMEKAKQLGNERIRRSSAHTVPKVTE